LLPILPPFVDAVDAFLIFLKIKLQIPFFGLSHLKFHQTSTINGGYVAAKT